MGNRYKFTQSMRNRIQRGHKKRSITSNKYSQNNFNRKYDIDLSKGTRSLNYMPVNSFTERRSDEFGFRVKPSDLILCNTLLKKPEEISIFPINEKKLKKWPMVKSSINMRQSFHFERNNILASGFGYQVIKGLNKKNGQSKIIKIINCETFGGVTEAKKVIREELNIHKSLQHSDCVLKLEQVFEAREKIYMVYQEGTIMSSSYLEHHLKKRETEELLFNILIALVELNSLGLAMGYISAQNIVLTNQGYMNKEAAQFKLFNFCEVQEYGEKYQTNQEDLKLGIGFDDKIVDSKTDSRCFGSLIAILYQKFSHNLVSSPLNPQYLKLLQTDSGLSHLERDLLSGIMEPKKEKRPNIKDLILHELYFQKILKSKQLQQKVTSTLFHTKIMNYKRLERKLRDISSGKVNPIQEKKKDGYFKSIGSFFQFKSQSNLKQNISTEDPELNNTSVGRRSANFNILDSKNGTSRPPFNIHTISLTPQPVKRRFMAIPSSKSSRNLVSAHLPDRNGVIDKSSSKFQNLKNKFENPKRKRKGFFGNLFSDFLCCAER